MHAERGPKAYHPAFRVLALLVTAAAVVVIALYMPERLARRSAPALSPAAFEPPSDLRVPFVSFAPIDSIIAGGSEAFARGDYHEASRLLGRARFFIESGMREGVFSSPPDNLDLLIGLSDFYRGYAERGIESAERAVRRDPLDETALWHLGSMLLAAGRAHEARGYFETVAGLDGRYAAQARALLARP